MKYHEAIGILFGRIVSEKNNDKSNIISYLYYTVFIYVYSTHTDTRNMLRRTNWKKKDTNRSVVVNCTYGF